MTEATVAAREAFGQALLDLGRRDPRVVVLSADLDDSVKTTAFARGLPDQYFQIGIAEQNMISIAAGLATTGKIPFAVTFAAIVATRALDQINISLAYSRLNVKVVGAYLGVLSGKTGATHQAIGDIAVMRALPNMIVLCPGDEWETRAAVDACAAYDGPVYMRVEREKVAPFAVHQEPFQIGKGILQRPGSDVTLVGCGMGAAWALAAADILAGRGVDARVISLHTIKPLDEEILLAAARETGGVVTVEHHSIIGGLGSAVSEYLCGVHPVRIERVGIRDVYGESGADDDLLRKYGLTPSDVVAAAERVLAAPGV